MHEVPCYSFKLSLTYLHSCLHIVFYKRVMLTKSFKSYTLKTQLNTLLMLGNPHQGMLHSRAFTALFFNNDALTIGKWCFCVVSKIIIVIRSSSR